jgi:hypothetical protein
MRAWIKTQAGSASGETDRAADGTGPSPAHGLRFGIGVESDSRPSRFTASERRNSRTGWPRQTRLWP